METTTPLKRTFWLSPSGRLHGMKLCSGAAPASRMRAITLTDEQWRKRLNKCKCASWHRAEAP